jgi:hypothetical protein
MNNPIDEYFKKNLADAEVQPRKNLFAEKIAPRIEKRTASHFFSPWLRVAAAVVVLFGAWQVLQIVNTPVPQNSVSPMEEQPVAVKQPATKTLPKATPQEEVQADEQPRAKRQAPKGNGGWVSTTPAGSAAENLEAQLQTETVVAAVEVAPAETKTNYKVKLRIDPAKYATQAQEEQVVAVEETPTITEYAATQFDNIKEGDKLQSPPKEWFDLPKVALRVDGNPLKKVLPNKE